MPPRPISPQLVDAGVRADLSGAFRLTSNHAPVGIPGHRAPDRTVYGLTELRRPAVTDAQLVANPGRYPCCCWRSRPLPAFSRPAWTSSSTPSGSQGRKTPSATHFSEIREHGRVKRLRSCHGAEIEQGRRRWRSDCHHPCRTWCRSIAYSRDHLHATHPAPPETLSTCSNRHARRRHSSGWWDRPCQIKHVAHTNFYDIGWQ